MIKNALASASKETILVVEDDDLVRELGERILRQAGYSVLTAKNGQEALQIYKREPGKIGVVILDLVMPVMGGKECLNELLKIDPAAKVLISTGASDDEGAKDGVASRAKGFVDKPYCMKRLTQAVHDVLEQD